MTKCGYCGKPVKSGHKNKEFCVPGVDKGKSCRQLAYYFRKKRSKRGKA